MNEAQKALVRTESNLVEVSTLSLISRIPEEEKWLQSLQSEQTRRAYKNDVAHFVRALNIGSWEELRLVEHGAVNTWRRMMKAQGAKPTTIRRRLSALSSLFRHLVNHRVVEINPVREVQRPRINRKSGKTRSFSQEQARAILDAPTPETLIGLRDRAILAVGFQVGCRRAEIANLKVKSYHMNAGYHALEYLQKGGTENALSIHPQVAQRIEEYMNAAGHRDDLEGPLFRPVRPNGRASSLRRFLNPDVIDKILRKYMKQALGITNGFSAHSMRATFITTALKNGADIEDVQQAVGHAQISTTKLYDKRGYNPERAASFFANY